MGKIIIANWKNHLETLEQARELFEFESAEALKYENVKTVFCLPEKFLTKFQVPGSKFQVALGAQDVFWSKPEETLHEIKYALVGHSDMRKAGDTDEIINQKLKLALLAGVAPILLVGEKERGDNRREVLETQLSGALLNCATSDVAQLMIAYEPVWAISINHGAESDTPENTLGAIEMMRKFLSSKFQISSSRFLYGGSITDKNVAGFLRHPEIGGVVVGGASLRKEEFTNILKIVSEL